MMYFIVGAIRASGQRQAGPGRATAASTTCAVLVALLVLLASGELWAHRSSENDRVVVAEPAPDFALTDQNDAPLALAELRGKVAVVTFFYTRCNQHCPLLTEKLASLQAPLAGDLGSRVRFVSISIDPQVDVPPVLLAYAKSHRANLAGWSFLTGARSTVEEVERAYGAQRKNYRLKVEHLFVTSVIDQHGTVRMKYMGASFSPDDLLRDVRTLLRE